MVADAQQSVVVMSIMIPGLSKENRHLPPLFFVFAETPTFQAIMQVLVESGIHQLAGVFGPPIQDLLTELADGFKTDVLSATVPTNSGDATLTFSSCRVWDV